MTDWKDRAERAEARVAKLEARLEIDHAFRIEPGKTDLVRFEIPANERDRFPDKITCLECDVELRDDHIKELKAELAVLRKGSRLS